LPNDPGKIASHPKVASNGGDKSEGNIAPANPNQLTTPLHNPIDLTTINTNISRQK
jgi:hypothetical protein